jgi:hypothetical protein
LHIIDRVVHHLEPVLSIKELQRLITIVYYAVLDSQIIAVITHTGGIVGYVAIPYRHPAIASKVNPDVRSASGDGVARAVYDYVVSADGQAVARITGA